MSKRQWFLLCLLLPPLQVAAIALVAFLILHAAPPGSGWDIAWVMVGGVVCLFVAMVPFIAIEQATKRDRSLRPYALGYGLWLIACMIVLIKLNVILAWIKAVMQGF